MNDHQIYTKEYREHVSMTINECERLMRYYKLQRQSIIWMFLYRVGFADVSDEWVTVYKHLKYKQIKVDIDMYDFKKKIGYAE